MGLIEWIRAAAGTKGKPSEEVTPAPSSAVPRRVIIGQCEACGRQIRVKGGHVNPGTRLTCRCGHVNVIGEKPKAEKDRDVRDAADVQTGVLIREGTGISDRRDETCDLACKLAGGWPAELDRAKLLAVDFEALVARLRKYQQMMHPGGDRRPEYRLVSGQVARVGVPFEDFKIATVASLLAGKARVTPFDDAASQYAYQVIQEYGGWRLAKFLFSIPRSFDIQADGGPGPKTIVIEDLMVDVYSATENLLFEIYEELAEGEVMDDARVRRKLVGLAYS